MKYVTKKKLINNENLKWIAMHPCKLQQVHIYAFQWS